MNIWLLAAGLIMLPLFLPIGAVIIFMAFYGDFTKKYMKEVKEEKRYEQKEFGTGVLEQGV